MQLQFKHVFYDTGILILFLTLHTNTIGQQKIAAYNFEDKQLDSSWQVVSGNWRIADVQEMRIAPAEGGYQYMLACGGEGYTGENMIRLFVDLPSPVKTYKKIKLQFYYYIIADAAKTTIETEFYQKNMKDGSRGKLLVDNLYRKKGMWSLYQQTMLIPARADQLRILFYGFKSTAGKPMLMCFDNINISVIK